MDREKKYHIIMIGKPSEEDIFAQELVQRLTDIGVKILPLYIAGIFKIIKKLPGLLKFILIKGRCILHFQFYISMVSRGIFSFLMIPSVSLFFLLFLILRIRIITTIHTVYPLSIFKLKISEFTSFPLLNKLGLLYWLFNIKAICRFSRKTIVLTSKAKTTLEKEYGVQNVAYIPIGCYKAQKVEKEEIKNYRKKININEKKKVILLFGAPSKGKGFFNVINVLPEVIRMIPDVKLLIVGGNPRDESGYLGLLKDLTRKLEIEKDVIFLGYVRREDIPVAISISDIAIFPYSEYEHEKERGVGASGALQEVLAYLKPIIVSSISTFDMLENGKTCLKVDVTQKRELIDAIVSILSNKEFYNSIVKHLADFVERNSIANMADRHLKIYQEVLK